MNMPAQKNITLHVNHSAEKIGPDFAALHPTENCNINIQLTGRWVVTGHYRNRVLHTIMLQKSSLDQVNKHG
jgi:hypothetical protein